ncbi:MAG TPA: winged helix-turn-helix domain-containing protein [Blastocatellia bacterium]|nr:winged helix-turn-helix domain-containing protein [Blastocatellia bacterium]
MMKPAKRLYEFGPYRVDAADRLLLKDGQVVPLSPKVFDILLAFVERSGRVLDKDELMHEVWPDTFVEEGNLARNISTLRRVLGDGDEGRQYIETIPRRGYRFVAKVKELSDGTLIVRERSRLTFEHEEENGAAGDADVPADASVPAWAEADGARFQAVAGALPQPSKPAVAEALAAPVAAPAPRLRRRLLITCAVALIAAALAASFAIGKRAGHSAPPLFQQLTFRNGTIAAARFAPDSRLVVYAALWEGRPSELFTTMPGTPESRPLDVKEMSLLAISASGEMAVLLKPRIHFISQGMLARMPLTGGAPREVLTNVSDADWSPDGKELAVIHYDKGQCRLEYPIGNVLYEHDTAGWISDVRVSPDGRAIAFLDHPVARFDDYGMVTLVDLKGNSRRLSNAYLSARGLAWSPAGDEVWFTADEGSVNHGLHAVSLQGKERLLARVPGRLSLQDVSHDGRVLMTREDARIGMMVQAPGEKTERDLSWLDGSWLHDLSPDGQTLLFDEENTAANKTPTVYVRQVDGSPAVKLGDGNAVSLSPDGRWALASQRYTSPPRLVLLPTGAGEMKVIESGEIEWRETGMWFPDSRRVVLMGKEPGHQRRSYVYDLERNELRPLTEEGTVVMLLAPDGKHMLAGVVGTNNQKVEVRALEGGEARPFTALVDNDIPISWAADNQAIFVVQRGLLDKVFKLNLATGQREQWKELMHADPAGLLYLSPCSINPDGRAYGYTYFRVLSQVYLVENVK